MMTRATKIFGTDGIRGRAGEGWLTETAVVALGRAIGAVFGQRLPAGRRRVLLGHDGRRSGPVLERALTRGLNAHGFGVTSVGLITTPGLATLTRELDFQVGAMISASHNPAEDNGIKLFDESGGKLADELEVAIEALLQEAREEPGEQTEPTPSVDASLEDTYVAHLIDRAGAGLALAGTAIVIDCANGAGSRVGPRVLERLGARVHAICAEPDGDNINRDCGSTHPEALQGAVLAHEAQLGIALDGDGDRCVLVDERGAVVHGDAILAICGRYAQSRGELAGGKLVATVMSNRGLHRALRSNGIGVVTCPVGDRSVVEALKRDGLQLGGEQSGHVVFGADNGFVGDGLYTALRVLRVLVETGEPLSKLAAVYEPLPQVLVNVPVERKPPLDEIELLIRRVASIEAQLGEDGRVLLRYSGTENLARVMVEGPDADAIRGYAGELAQLVREAIGRDE